MRVWRGVEAQDLGNTRLRGEAREDAPGCSNLWGCVWRTLARACGASVGGCVRVGCVRVGVRGGGEERTGRNAEGRRGWGLTPRACGIEVKISEHLRLTAPSQHS